MCLDSANDGGDSDNPADIAGTLFEGYDKKLGSVAPKAVLSTLGLMVLWIIGTIVAFSILRPRHRIIYAPKAKFAPNNKQPPPLSDSFFSWIGILLTPIRSCKHPQNIRHEIHSQSSLPPLNHQRISDISTKGLRSDPEKGSISSPSLVPPPPPILLANDWNRNDGVAVETANRTKVQSGWARIAKGIDESELIEKIGLDAVGFLRFLRMGRWMFLTISAVTCFVLIPIDIRYNFKYVPKWKRSALSMCSIQNIRGNTLWAHVGAVYVITLIVLFFLWINYRALVQLKQDWFRTEEYQRGLNSRSLMITRVSKAYQSDSGVAAMLSKLDIPYPTTDINIGRSISGLPEMIKCHNLNVCRLERVLTTYLSHPEKDLPSKRPTMKLGSWFGIGGTRVDAIDLLTKRINEQRTAIQNTRERIGEKKAVNYGFASFATVPSAHIVAQKLHHKRYKGARFELAPHPREILWDNLTWSSWRRLRAKIFGSLLLVVFFVIYMIPLIALAFFANLAAVSRYIPFLEKWDDSSNITFSIFTGIVPPLLALLLQLLLPVVLRSIARDQGATTEGKLDTVVCRAITDFSIISQFLFFSLLGVAFNLASEIVDEVGDHKSFITILKNLKKVPKSVQTTYIQQGSYWLTFFALRGANAIFDLARVVELFWISLRIRLFGGTPRQIREISKPPEFDFANYTANHIFLVVVGVIYSPLVPLVGLFAAVAFFASSLTYKYQLLFVFVTRSETGFRLWRIILNRFLLSLVLMQLLMLLTIGLQRTWIEASAVVPPILIVFIYKFVLEHRFSARFRWYLGTTNEMGAAKQHKNDARMHRLERRFGHPSLTSELYTPIIHKKSEHLLRKVYGQSKMEISARQVDGQEIEEARVGGLTFDALERQQLQYSQASYLRQHSEFGDLESEWETSTIAPTTRLSTLVGAPVGEPLSTPVTRPGYCAINPNQHGHYIQHGPSSPGMPVPSFGRRPDSSGTFASSSSISSSPSMLGQMVAPVPSRMMTPSLSQGFFPTPRLMRPIPQQTNGSVPRPASSSSEGYDPNTMPSLPMAHNSNLDQLYQRP